MNFRLISTIRKYLKFSTSRSLFYRVHFKRILKKFHKKFNWKFLKNRSRSSLKIIAQNSKKTISSENKIVYWFSHLAQDNLWCHCRFNWYINSSARSRISYSSWSRIFYEFDCETRFRSWTCPKFIGNLKKWMKSHQYQIALPKPLELSIFTSAY